MRHVSYEQAAWATNPAHIQQLQDSPRVAALTDPTTDMTTEGWVRVGTATISVELYEESDIKLAAVQQCNEAIKKVRVDTEVKVAHLEQMIQNLLAIEYAEPEQVKLAPDFTDVDDDDIPF